MNVSIYETDKSNASRAFELMRLAFNEQRGFVDPEPIIFRGDSIRSISSDLDKKEKRLIVALHRSRLLGAVFCGADKNNPTEDFYFSHLAIRPRYRNNGVGRQLVEEIESTARSEKAKRVTCAVRIALRQNVSLFEHLGYEIVGEGTHTGFDSPTYYNMAKVL